MTQHSNRGSSSHRRQTGQMIDEQDPVQMVDLVLDDPRHQTLVPQGRDSALRGPS